MFKSTNETSLESLPKGKVILTVAEEDPESIWVAKDIVNNKMYLLNHAINFHPIPSWGSEWDLADELDIAEARGKSFDDTVLTFHSEAHDVLSEFITNDSFNVEAYLKLKKK